MAQAQNVSSNAVSGLNPLSYLGSNQPANVLIVISRNNRFPFKNDKNYKLGTLWVVDKAALFSFLGIVNNEARWILLAVIPEPQPLLKQETISSSPTDFVGQATLKKGIIRIPNSNIVSTDRIFVTRSAINESTAVGELVTSVIENTNFTIKSVKTKSPGKIETGDNSTVDYIIMNQSITKKRGK